MVNIGLPFDWTRPEFHGGSAGASPRRSFCRRMGNMPDEARVESSRAGDEGVAGFVVDLGVVFFVISPAGELLGSTYPITKLTLEGSQVVGANPEGLKDYGLIDLIREGRIDEPRRPRR